MLSDEHDSVFMREIYINAPQETLWNLLTDPREIVEWMGIHAAFEASIGTQFRIEVVPGKFASGFVLESEPPKRIAYTWGWEDPTNPVRPGSSTVTFDLEPSNDGTLLRLTHSDLPQSASHTHATGWNHYLDRLKKAAQSTPPGPDPWLSLSDLNKAMKGHPHSND